MKKGFSQISKFIIWLICASALLFTGINFATPSMKFCVQAGGSGIEYNYAYTGDIQTINLSAGEYVLECWGANGGDRKGTALGGTGGYSKGTLVLDSATTFYLGIGGFGGSSNANAGGTVLGTAGYNGGGQRFGYTGGGGATHISTTNRGVLSSYADHQDEVVIVAGGGGSVGAANKPGANGGGLTGAAATQSYGSGGQGGTQVAGGMGNASYPLTRGSFGKGGQGYYYANGYSGAGGGGWYGGAGSYPDGSGDDDRGGGGGSGYIGGVASGLCVQPTETGFVANPDTSGNGYIRIFRECIKYTFNFDNGHEFLSIERGVEETDLEIPAEIPAKVGYVFTHWSVDGDSTEYNSGMTYNNVSGRDVIFNAVFTEAVYDIVFTDDDYSPQLHKNDNPQSIENYTIQIGEEEITLAADISTASWTSGLRWMVKIAGTDGSNPQDWIEIGSTQTMELNQILTGDESSIEFINNYVDYESANGNVGKITFKIADINDSYVVDLSTNISGAGTFKIAVNDGALVAIAFGNKISLPKTGKVTSIIATANPHYRFVNFKVYNGGEAVTTIDSAAYDSSNDSFFDLDDSSGLKTGYRIEVNFEKIEYHFDVIAATKGQENNPINNLLSIENSSSISINEAASFNAIASEQSNKYKFIAWKIYDHISEAYTYEPSGMLGFSKSYSDQEITAAWLARFVKNGAVTVVAEYAELYHVQVSFAENQESFGTLTVSVYDAHAGEETQYNFVDLLLIKGSYLTIQARAHDLYEFVQFTNILPAEIGSSASSAEIQIDGDRQITAVFKPKAFEIIFNAKDSDGNTIVNSVKYSTETNNIDNIENTISINDTLNSIIADRKIAGYRFDSFSILDADGTKIDNPDNLFINEEILRKNFNRLNQFIITANYTKLYTFNINVSDSTTGMGSYQVFTVDNEGAETPTNQLEFPINTNLIIRTKAKNEYYSFDKFTGNSQAEFDSSLKELRLTLSSPRAITVYFKKKPFDLITDLTKKGTGNTAIDKTQNLKTGDSVILTAAPGSSQEIKKWTINGINIEKLAKDKNYDVKVSNTAVTLTLTSAWLEEFGTDINSKVEFGMASAISTIITVTSIAVPLLLVIFLFYFINLKRKTALIKKELHDEYKTKQKFDTSSLLSDLREGKEIGVSDEAVKKALKENKKKSDSKT